eukprot:TRINITY_DN214_c0_g2_i1.p1 TRINITY_DN214_c0_g2~~TRINITY_DN214_c0_g2_i1.p1  ORF type:complete len:373 (-),score=47.92 TRINITY_DN214_c0_g2_i1:55-1173(-)
MKKESGITSSKASETDSRALDVSLEDGQEARQSLFLDSTQTSPTKSSTSSEMVLSVQSSSSVRDQLTSSSRPQRHFCPLSHQAELNETGEKVAIKKVLVDKRYKSREIDILKRLKHPNIITFKHAYTTVGDQLEDTFLNIVTDYVPDTLSRTLKHYSRSKKRMPNALIKVIMYQILKALAYLARFDICHRDIRPQNILYDPDKLLVKLCDFGSAKKMVKGEINISYMCARNYRAPELVFGSSEYTCAIDIWSAGCIWAEMLLFDTLFNGENTVDYLVEVIRVVGPPTAEDIKAMNPLYADFKFPKITRAPWEEVLRGANFCKDTLALMERIFVYNPERRIRAEEALKHPYFDEIKESNFKVCGIMIPSHLFE